MSKFRITINGNAYEVAVQETGNNTADVEISGKKFSVQVEQEEQVFHPVSAPRPAAAPAASGKKMVSKAVRSPLPGNVLKVFVTVGQAVKRGDTLVTIESMKMENAILAETDGVVKGVLVSAGQSVMPGDVLVDFGAEQKELEQPAPQQQQVKQAVAGKKTVTSPLPGTVLKVLVDKGAKVKRGDTILTVESMKMENSIMAERDGVVTDIFVKSGQNLMQGDALFVLE